MKEMSANVSPHAFTPSDAAAIRRYNAFLLLVAGLGGLLYGIDVGIIGGAYPYLAATSGLTASQLSVIVAAVLLGSVLSTLFAGMLADWMGRKPLMILSGITFALSIPVIALSQGYAPLFFGRLLQGMSAGLVGVVVPLYLAECLSASNRGKGTAIFQWLLTLGIVAAALVGIFFSYRVAGVQKLGDAAALFHFEDHAWRSIFWVSLPPGLLFVLGGFFVTESPRWLFRRNRKEQAHAALLKSRSPEQAALELEEMETTAHEASPSTGERVRDSLLRRKYVIPFLLACVHGHQRGHPVQHRHSVAERNERSAGALGLRDLHGGEFSGDHDRHGAGGPQGPQIPASDGHMWRDRGHGGRGTAVQNHGKTLDRLPRPGAGAGRAEPGADDPLRCGGSEQTAERRGRCWTRNRQQSRIAGNYLFLRRLYRRHQLCALRRCGSRAH
jgi:hypothetical protein